MPPSFVGVTSAKVPIAILKRLLHSPSKRTDLDQQIKTAAASGKATRCHQASSRHRKCIHTMKPTEKTQLQASSPRRQGETNH